VQVMRELFAENLHLMAEYGRPWPHGKPPDLRKIRTLREKISQNFLAVNTQGDAVLFETGRSRDQSLAVRDRLRGWQPQVRSIFLLEIALLQYRLQISPRQLPAPVLLAWIHLDGEVSALLEGIARVFRFNDTSCQPDNIQRAHSDLEQAILDAYHPPTPRGRALLAVSAQLIELACPLLAEIKAAPLQWGATGTEVKTTA
jgi:multidrug resistance protein MdtO